MQGTRTGSLQKALQQPGRGDCAVGHRRTEGQSGARHPVSRALESRFLQAGGLGTGQAGPSPLRGAMPPFLSGALLTSVGSSEAPCH